MSLSLRQQDPDFVRSTFSAIAERYDFANHLLSGGLDFFWRARVARLVARKQPGQILDLATGSGDLAIALQKACPAAYIIGADFCPSMLDKARRKKVRHLIQADGLALPFANESFDAITIGFGLRNMASWEKALSEMARVLRPGGLLAILDFSLPSKKPIRTAYRFYLHHVLPKLAGWTTGCPAAYEYLGESIENFPCGSEMTTLINSCGFEAQKPQAMCLGIVSIYPALKKTPNQQSSGRKEILSP